MEEFDEEGIQKIADLADDLTALMDRLDAVTEADKDYTVFDGWEKDTDGSKIHYRDGCNQVIASKS